MGVDKVINFVLGLKYEDLPAEAIRAAKRNLIDTIATAAAGRKTACADIIIRYANQFYNSTPEKQGPIYFDSRTASFPGSALASAMLTDAYDAHDTSVPTNGHVGVAIWPALMSLISQKPMTGKEFLTAAVVEYELAERAGLALHATVDDYHTSGAWNALGCAAVVARELGLTPEQTKEAIGIAEYYGPRSQMMRCIEFPTMIKDGSGWGAMTGVSAALLAKDGFTGAPAITVTKPEVQKFYTDLGKVWMVAEQSFKPYPVCYWAQPAMTSLQKLMEKEPVDPDNIVQVEVQAFHYACCLHTVKPKNTEEAQYSLPYPMACFLVRGKVGVDEVTNGFNDPKILAMSEKVKIIENPEYEKEFQKFHRWSHVVLHLKDGSTRVGPRMEPWGMPGSPAGRMSDELLLEKAKDLLECQLSPDVTKDFMAKMQRLETFDNVMEVFQPIYK